MNLRTISTIISREYLSRVKKKSFLVTTFLGPILFAAVCILPSVIMATTKEEGQAIAVRDCSGFVMPYMVSNEAVTFSDYSILTLDEFKALENYTAQVNISEYNPETKSVDVIVYTRNPLSMSTRDVISRNVNDAVEAYRLQQYNIANLKEIMAEVQANVDITTVTLGKDGEETVTEDMVFTALSFILASIIYMFITLFSAMVMRGVIEEKASKIVEVLMSSVRATDLMFGKIIGVALVALTQFFLWIGLTAVIVGGYMTISGVSAEALNQANQLQAAGTEVVVPEVQNVVLSTLAGLPLGTFFIAFLLYFVFGFLLYASLFAAIGSAVENEADTNQLQLPVTAPLLIGFFVAIYAFNAPGSDIVLWCSHIPFTSPIVMLARIPYGVPVWELAVSICLLIGAFFACAWLSAKIYQVGILTSGKKTTFKDLYRWLRMKQ